MKESTDDPLLQMYLEMRLKNEIHDNIIPKLDPFTMNSPVCQKGSHTPPLAKWGC